MSQSWDLIVVRNRTQIVLDNLKEKLKKCDRTLNDASVNQLLADEKKTQMELDILNNLIEYVGKTFNNLNNHLILGIVGVWEQERVIKSIEVVVGKEKMIK